MRPSRLHLGKGRVTDLERDFLSAVYRICRSSGVYAHHCQSICHGKGWPDLVLIGNHGVLFREVKSSPVDVVRREQTTVLYLLKANGQDAGIWRPEDLRCGAVAQQIGDIA